MSSLKSSAVINAKRSYAMKKEHYQDEFSKSFESIRLKLPTSSGEQKIDISIKLSILTAPGDMPWQSRVILKCPAHIPPNYVERLITNAWAKNPWVAHTDLLLSDYASRPNDDFLDIGWDGKLKPVVDKAA